MRAPCLFARPQRVTERQPLLIPAAASARLPLRGQMREEPRGNPFDRKEKVAVPRNPRHLRRCARLYRVMPQGQIFLFQATNPQNGLLKARLSSVSPHTQCYPTTSLFNPILSSLLLSPLPLLLSTFHPTFYTSTGPRIFTTSSCSFCSCSTLILFKSIYFFV